MAAIRSLNIGDANGITEEKGNWGTPDSSYQEVSRTYTSKLSSCHELGWSYGLNCLCRGCPAEVESAMAQTDIHGLPPLRGFLFYRIY